MKKHFLLFMVIAVVASAFTMLTTPEKDILGKWVIDINSVEAMTKATIEVTKRTNPEQAAKMEANIEEVNAITAKTNYVFNEDNTFTVQSNGDPQPGTWAFSDDKKFLLLTRNGKTRKDSIIELTPKRLQLFHGDRKVATLFIRP
jgi:hypothetical protein